MNTEPEISEDTRDQKEGMQCACCDTDISENDCMYLEGHGDVCNQCYDENTHTCQLCNEDGILKRDLSRYIVVKTELADCGRCCLPGIYKIKREGFYMAALIGSGMLFESDILFIDRLPQPDHKFEISGHICKKCAKPYQKKWAAVYGGIKDKVSWRQNRLGKTVYCESPLVKKEQWYTYRTIREHPEMLYDLETDYGLEDLRERFFIPKHYRTWHEWVALDYKGVKVYHTGSGLASTWMVMRPEPEYRNTHKYDNPTLFAPSGLKTYPRDDKDGNRHYYHKEEANLTALKAAIDCGILTQAGVNVELNGGRAR